MKQLISETKHREALTGAVDVPQQRPSFPMPLPAVGISQKTVWVQLPLGLLPFQARLEVDLPGDRRGIHMSRLEEVISRLYERSFATLGEYGEALGREILLCQEATGSRVELSGSLPLVRKSLVSGRNSLDSIDVKTEVRFRKEGSEAVSKTITGVGVYHITACPCTQAYNQIVFAGKDSGGCPLPTHSQRSHTWLLMEVAAGRPDFDEQLSCLEASLHVTQDLLKRQDEAEVVLRAHSLPQFAEDAVRQTAYAVGQAFFSVLPGATVVKIESVSQESIHIHDVHCVLETTLAEIHEYMKIG